MTKVGLDAALEFDGWLVGRMRAGLMDAMVAMAPQKIRFTPDGLDWKGMEAGVRRMGARMMGMPGNIREMHGYDVGGDDVTEDADAEIRGGGVGG